jgi:hypothetical protein
MHQARFFFCFFLFVCFCFLFSFLFFFCFLFYFILFYLFFFWAFFFGGFFFFLGFFFFFFLGFFVFCWVALIIKLNEMKRKKKKERARVKPPNKFTKKYNKERGCQVIDPLHISLRTIVKTCDKVKREDGR